MRKNLLWISLMTLLTISLLSVNMIEITVAQADHDIAVISVTPSPTSVKLGELVNVTVVVENQGTNSETFNVTAYYDNTIIGELQNVTDLPPGNQTTLTFSWNTTDAREEIYAKTAKEKTYDINATATIALDEDPDDNTLVSPSKVDVISQYITVIPQSTVDPDLTPGKNYTVSIYTDYNGSDIWSWQFTLSYNPNVLHGGINKTDTWTGTGTQTTFYTTQSPVVPHSEKVYVNETLMTRNVDYLIIYEIGGISFTTAPGADAEIKAIYLYNGVVNGDLVTQEKNETVFAAGTFNNTIGKLPPTMAWFYYTEKPIPTTYGPGILANVTFTVVGTGDSDITLVEMETKLTGYNATTGTFYEIVKYFKPGVGHILHGYFRNTAEAVTHDVAVISVTPNATSVDAGELVSVTVVVENQGTSAETFEVTAYYYPPELPSPTTEPHYRIATPETVQNLGAGANTSLTFVWDTTDIREGIHSIWAEADTVLGEKDTGDNRLESENTVTVKALTKQHVPIELVIGIVIVVVVVGAVAAYVVKRGRKPTLE